VDFQLTRRSEMMWEKQTAFRGKFIANVQEKPTDICLGNGAVMHLTLVLLLESSTSIAQQMFVV
jgi:hypothetical protein